MRTSPRPDDREPALLDPDEVLGGARERMPEEFHAPRRPLRLLRVVGALLVALLVAGAAAGLVLLADDDPPRVVSAAAPRTAQADGLRLTLPGDWREAERLGLRGLGLRGAVALEPAGARGRAGLVVGRATRTTATLVPTGLADELGGADARRRRVQLGGVEALRIEGRTTAPRRTVAWLVPRRRGVATLVCYARTAAWTQRFGRCERVAATVARAGRARSLRLAPSPRFAQDVRGVLGRLNGERASGGELLRAKRTQVGQRSAALRLWRAHATAARELAAARAPAIARPLHEEAVAGLRDLAAGYHALAAAVSGRHRPSWAAARRAVRRGEARTAAALRELRVLGYPSAPRGAAGTATA